MNQIVRKAATVAALGVSFGAAATIMNAVQEPILPADAQAVQVPAGAVDLATAFRAASKAALPGVVHVEVQAAPRAVSRQVPEQFRGTPFEDFFGGPNGGGPMGPQRGSGSGFVISPDGYIITNNHVVKDASRVTVTLTDKREYDARVVGRDPNTDIAVLKVDAKNLPTVRLGNADELQIGDWVLALGYPMQLGETVTAGIISAKGRSLGIIDGEDTPNPLESFIQTDAAINPGNSGGPLVNLRGEVIGVNTAIASQTGTYSGYGFAVPVSIAKRVADDLVRHGAVRRPKLGVAIRPVSLADAEVFGLSAPNGAVVASLQAGPAADAGIRMGDVIVAVAGKPVADTEDLMEQVALRQPGETIPVEIIRYGDRRRVNIRLGAFESAAAAPSAAAPASSEPLSRLGFSAAATERGVVVANVDPSSPAYEAGITQGFQLERINGKEVDSPNDLQGIASDLRPGSTVSVVGRMRDGSQTIVNYRLRR